MKQKVAVIGGGLAGLSAAARLSHYGFDVTLLEKAPKLGGRAITIPVKGFHFNFGAHAIYGRDTSILRKYEHELGLKVDWADFSPKKAHYDLGTFTTPVPATLEGLMQTKVLDAQNKLRFAYDIFKTISTMERGEEGILIGDYLKKEPPQVRDFLLTLGSSNFFTNEPEKIPSPLFFRYYRRLFSTRKPVAYIRGGWQSIIEGLESILLRNGGKIVSKEKIESVVVENGAVRSVIGKENQYDADHFVFCVPPSVLVSLFESTPYRELLAEYNRYESNQVVVYDIGLQKRIESPFTYIYHKGERIFITDISYYDPTCIPEGGQLMQAVAYLNKEEINANKMDEKLEHIEFVYDKHFPGWRDLLAAKRISKKATVQEIKTIDDQRLMPVKFYSLLNAYFAGDWCEGEGQLSELSFSSAYEVTKRIMEQTPSPVVV
ncbi:phytoene desaturase family protein [Effusibacillus dendaii]|uniref:Dehydrogenase n=1 Tax=Effusibacillus dendaii TaxID=2743772 RepID=A0A7I8DDY0_9BACL|nr:FAD-dependent oxidoreductase [Effusibacillus dendaii]BCJ88413.1 dehydrogenase [Effusibacillus dendaii]